MENKKSRLDLALGPEETDYFLILSSSHTRRFFFFLSKEKTLCLHLTNKQTNKLQNNKTWRRNFLFAQVIPSGQS